MSEPSDNLAAAFEAAAGRAPDKDVVLCADTALSWRELDARAGAVAAASRHHVWDGVPGGIQVGHHVNAEHSAQFFVRRLEAAHGDVAGVRHHQVDPSSAGHRPIDQVADRRLV